MASWGHTLGRENVFSTWLYTWRVYDGLAACGVIYTAMPEVGRSFVKMRNMWLPTATGGKPPFLKKYPECLSSRDLVGRRALLVQIECFYSEMRRSRSQALWWRSGAARARHLAGQSLLSLKRPCASSHTERKGGPRSRSALETVILASGSYRMAPCQCSGCEAGGKGGPEAKFT